MKKAELKKILKPLIKECVREAILDEGILSGIILEVTRGMSGVRTIPSGAPLVETKTDPVAERMKRNAFNTEQSARLKEHKIKLMSAIGDQAYNGVNLFEGTTPSPGQTSESHAASPLAGQDPGDAGVDITGLLGVAGKNWGAHMSKKK